MVCPGQRDRRALRDVALRRCPAYISCSKIFGWVFRCQIVYVPAWLHFVTQNVTELFFFSLFFSVFLFTSFL